MGGFNENEILRVRSTVENLIGAGQQEVPGYERKVCDDVIAGAAERFGTREDGTPDCDRIFIFNPDAIGSWIYEKYREKFMPLVQRADIAVDMLSVFPPLTPVCFASMYSGLAPSEHGIQRYVKPTLKADTIFDYLPLKKYRVAIVCTSGDSIAEIFKGREVDYFIYDSIKMCNDKAFELIERDEHDMIVLYNGNYDWAMHRFGPEGKRSMLELEKNIAVFCELHDFISEKWTEHNTTLMFAADHGCHRQLLPPGSHGKNIEKDMNIKHFYSFLCRK